MKLEGNVLSTENNSEIHVHRISAKFKMTKNDLEKMLYAFYWNFMENLLENILSSSIWIVLIMP